MMVSKLLASNHLGIALKLPTNYLTVMCIEDALREESVMSKAPFDLCSFFHVLEFFVDPFLVLKNLYPLVAENGIVYIATGLFNTRSIMQESHFGLIPSTFNQYSLSMLLQAIGFEVLSSKIVSKGRTLQVIARKNSDSKKISNNSRRLKQLDIINKHICSELGLDNKEDQFKVTTTWSGGSKTGTSRKAVLTYVPSKNKENTPVYFIHKKKDPVILVK